MEYIDETNLVRLKGYDSNYEAKYKQKSKRAVTRLLKAKNKKRPVLVLLYSMGCGHCKSLMENQIDERGNVTESEWVKARNAILGAKDTIILQINYKAKHYFIEAARKVPQFAKLVEQLEPINAVPAIFGLTNKNIVKECDDGRNYKGLVFFADELKK